MTLVLAAVLFWSTLGVIGKTLYGLGAEPLFVVTFRVLFALGILGAGLGLVRPRLLRVPRGRLPGLALYGVVAVGANFALFFLALQHTTVATAIVVAYSHPALVALLAWPLLGERLNLRRVLALALTAGGVFLVAGGYEPGALQANLLGLGYALGNALCLAAYNLLGKRLIVRVDPWTVMVYGFVFGGAFLAALWGARGAVIPTLPAAGWLLIVALAAFPSILAYGLYLLALRRLEASRAAIVATLEPVLAAAWAWLALGEGMLPGQLVGGALVIAGVLVLRVGAGPRPATN
ncbi:EamA family transporter [Candidatus Bipolaricaulota bacterium]|nr:EamA family transporter [Candidatus Bipolaricaulota bacterium]